MSWVIIIIIIIFKISTTLSQFWTVKCHCFSSFIEPWDVWFNLFIDFFILFLFIYITFEVVIWFVNFWHQCTITRYIKKKN